MKSKLVKTLSLTLASLIFLAVIGSFGFADDMPLGYKPTYGDVNIDGEITSSDATTVIRYLGGFTELSTLSLINADVNGDMFITADDAEIINLYLAGSITVFPVQNSDAYTLEFVNESFPVNGAVLPFGKAYSIIGSVVSNVLLENVSIKILNLSAGGIEVSASVDFEESDNAYIYNTKRSSNSIDNKIRFADLSEGDKKIEIYASTMLSTNALIYSAEFTVKKIVAGGAVTLGDISGFVYNGNSRRDVECERGIVDYLNSLDQNEIGNALVLEGIRCLGTNYETMDCSAFTRHVYREIVGITLPRISVDQARYCVNNDMTVTSSELSPGDLVFIAENDCHCGRYHEIHHVSMYLGNVDGTRYYIESSSSLDGVVIRVMWGNSGSDYRIDCYGRPYGA